MHDISPSTLPCAKKALGQERVFGSERHVPSRNHCIPPHLLMWSSPPLDHHTHTRWHLSLCEHASALQESYVSFICRIAALLNGR